MKTFIFQYVRDNSVCALNAFDSDCSRDDAIDFMQSTFSTSSEYFSQELFNTILNAFEQRNIEFIEYDKRVVIATIIL